MRDPEHLKDILAHAAWADAMFFHAWGKGDREDAELRDRLRHINATASYFLKVVTDTMDVDWPGILKGTVRPPWANQPLPDFETLRRDARENHECLSRFIAGLDAAGLQRPVAIPWFPDPPCVVTLGEAMVQVAMHTQHHRGQAMTRLKATGGKPVNVDYLIWLWKGRPVPVWG